MSKRAPLEDTTPRSLLRSATTRLAPLLGPDEAALEAQSLILHVLGFPAIHPLDPSYDRPVAHGQAARVNPLVDRRLAGEPLGYLVGRVRFRSLTMVVDRRVLLPRRATSTLVDVAVDSARASGWRSPRIADVCTGSGAVALALATELPGATVVATDASADALAVARENVARLDMCGLGGRVELRRGDLLAPLGEERFDMIVANPPYIPTPDLATLIPEAQWEPRGALDGGADGLDLVRRIVAGARERLVTGGLLAIEHGTNQHDPVTALLAAAGFAQVRSTRDAGAILRVASGRA